MSSTLKFEVPTWNGIYDSLLLLADRIRLEQFEPEIIVGISRGGWFPTRILSDLLQNSCIASVGAQFYSGLYETNCEPHLTQPLTLDVVDKRILLVDDVVDSGKSAVFVKRHLSQRGAKEIKLLTLYCKPWSAIKPNFCGKETSDWVVFPWEVKETLTKLARKCGMTNESFEAAVSNLIKSGVDKELIDRFLNNQHSR